MTPISSCFDKQNSEFKKFLNSNNILWMHHYRSEFNLISDDFVFTISENRHMSFCKQSVHANVIQAKLRGFLFKPLTDRWKCILAI
jgi:hypothetical protein